MTECYLLSEMFRDSQIVIITNFIVVSSVGIKRAVCRMLSLQMDSQIVIIMNFIGVSSVGIKRVFCRMLSLQMFEK